MPRLSRIRISGNRYDGFKKRHENTVFDLSSGANGDHSLLTLQNGSGKGVMLQLIFQIMLPGTSWGSNNGNKLEGMFYDRYNVFKPYTFHVALEWNLESPDKKKLLAGICVSARWQKSVDDSDGKVGLKYFLYTHEYKGESRFSLTNLPLYSKSAGGVLDYDSMESFIDENRQYFIKHSKSSVQSLNSSYYQYLSSHGIYRSEWEIMKIINRSEGGLEKYFSTAKDNQALFDKLIIPAVSESISSRGGENDRSLTTMFVDNIKIARDLPELIARTEDINQLLQFVVPLLTDAEHGIKLQKTGQMIRERGNNYLQALQNRLSVLQNELRRSKDEREKTGSIIEDLRYEEANLKYARKKRDLDNLKNEKREFDEEIEVLQNNLLELREEEKGLKINQDYLIYQGYQKKFQQNRERIAYLREASGLSDLRYEIVDTSENIKKAWPELKRQLEENSQDISAYKNYLDSRGKSLRQEQEILEKNIRERELTIERYKDDVQSLSEKRDKLSNRFNSLQLGTPFYLLEQISTDQEKITGRIEKLKKQRENKIGEIESLQKETAELRIESARKENKHEELERLYQARKKEEEEIRLSLVNLLGLDKFKEVYNQDWLAEKKLSLTGLLDEKINRLQDLNNKNYEIELDLSLNNEDFWIANYDQKSLYKLITDLDIKVYYGSDFLLNLVDNREEILEQFPLLPYGLILMYEADWEKVIKNMAEDVLHRAAVPVFINYQLEANVIENSFRLASGLENDFISFPESYKKWYDSLENQQKEIAETKSALEKKIESIRRVKYSADILQQERTSRELAVKLSELKGDKEKIMDSIESLNNKENLLRQERESLGREIVSAEDKKNRLAADYREIKEFADESKRLEEKKAEIKEDKDKLIELRENLSRNSTEKEETMSLKLKIDNDRERWMRDIGKFLLELSEIIPDIKFEEKIVEKVNQNYPVLYDYRDSRVNSYYQNLLDLEREEEEKTVEIKYLREKQDSLRELILKKEENLKSLDSEWKMYCYTSTSEREINIVLERVVEQIKQCRERIDGLKERSNILTGAINSIKRQINELYQDIASRFSRTARSWEDIDLKKKEIFIKESLEENEKYRVELEDMIEVYSEKIGQISNLINKLEFYQLNADKGEINDRLEELVRDNPFDLIEQWVKDFQEMDGKLKELREKTENDFYIFKRNVNEIIKNNILKIKIKEKIIQDFRSDNYSFNYEMLSSFREYLHNELNRLDDNRAEAERARNQWAERSSMHVIRIITSLKDMINNMVFHNQRGYAFPLVRMRRNDLLPELEDEIVPELKEYFVELISRFNKKGINIDRLTDSELKEYTGDAALFSRAVRGRYPVLQVYKMTEKNEFQYAKPQDYFYADWESVIQGKGDTPEGSGGQSLSINAFMMMMLLNYKKQRFDKTNPWTVMFLDNPFGKASAAHVLDPIFEIANKLNFQIIAFAAPEIIKTEISERFPVFYPLEISTDDKGNGVVSISGQVVYGERIRRT